MDVRRDGWWGSCTVNGKNLVINNNMVSRGTIMSLIAESLKSLQTERARNNADGESEIVIRIRNQPFSSNKESVAQMERATEVEAFVESNEVDGGPKDGEIYEDYFDRLLNEGYPRATALMLSAEWFEREKDPLTELWLTDPKAIRFRELNTRHSAFEAALPSEYESLKHYVIHTYPSFTEHMTFRTA